MKSTENNQRKFSLLFSIDEISLLKISLGLTEHQIHDEYQAGCIDENDFQFGLGRVKQTISYLRDVENLLIKP